MFSKIAVLVVFLVCSSAHARDNRDNDDMYKNWNDVVSLLRLRGVEASKIEWTLIDPSCQIIKNTVSEIAYNKCRFKKALDQNQYGSDTNYCNAESTQKYFEYLKPNARGSKAAPKLSDSEIDEFKNSAYLQCMYKTGWYNPDSWVNGRRESFYKD